MDLTSRPPGYRAIAIRCPGCADPMTIVPIEDAELDICDGCGGLWVDWFDGEVLSVAQQEIRNRYTGRRSSPDSMHNEPVAIGACPRCTQQLVDERYQLQNADTGAHLLRCESCAGAFVSRATAELLATLTKDDPPPPSESPKVLEPLPWDRFLAIVKRIFGA